MTNSKLQAEEHPAQIERNKIMRPLSILVAEDSVINQKVASRILENRGHQVTIARNGREAVAAMEKESFDLVLMDVQMPEMDGFQATALIRAAESLRGRHTPIIALTAHAMKGDRERCLDAGMDDYISKPVRSQELFLAIENAINSVASERASDVVDWADVLERIGGDTDFLRELIFLFSNQTAQLLQAIRSAMSAGDSRALEQAAHALRGAIGNFSQVDAYEAALHLEKLAGSGRLAGADEALAGLEQGLTRLQMDLKNWETVQFPEPGKC